MLGYRLIPEARMKEYGKPPQKIPRSPGHHREWINACKGGPAARANFDWAGPLTESVLVGNIALKMEKELYQKGLKLHYDGRTCRSRICPRPTSASAMSIARAGACD